MACRILVPFQHLQPAARVQFGQGVIHVSPCEGRELHGFPYVYDAAVGLGLGLTVLKDPF